MGSGDVMDDSLEALREVDIPSGQFKDGWNAALEQFQAALADRCHVALMECEKYGKGSRVADDCHIHKTFDSMGTYTIRGKFPEQPEAPE